MADQKIDGFYSEYDIRTDKASTSLKNLGKEEAALQKTLKSGKKETAARSKATVDQGKTAEKERKAAEKRRKNEEKEEKNKAKAFEKEKKTKESLAKQAAKKSGDTVSGAAGLAGGVAGGGAIGAVAAVLPLGLGALIVGAMAAINRAAGAIETVASGSKDRARAARASAGIEVGGNFGKGFSAADVRGAKTALGEFGVEKLSPAEIATLHKEGKRVGSLSDAVQNVLSGKNLRSLGQEGKNAETILSSISDDAQTADFKAHTALQMFGDLLERQKKKVGVQTKASGYSLGINKRSDALADKEYTRATKLAGVEGIDEAINATRDADDFFVKGAATGAAATVKKLKQKIKQAESLSKGNLKTAFGPSEDELDRAVKANIISKEKRDALLKEREAEDGGGGSSEGGAGGDMGGGGGSGGGSAAPGVSVPSVTFNIYGATDAAMVAKEIEKSFASIINKYAGTELAAELGLRGGAF